MTGLVVAFALIVALIAALLRVGGASLVRTPRADALHDAAEGDPGAERVARLLEDADLIVPSINIVHSLLLITAAAPLAWAVTIAGRMVGVLLVATVVGLSLCCDLIPRMIGRARPRWLAYRFAPLLAPAIAVGSRAAEILYTDDEEEEAEPEDPTDVEEVGLIESVLVFAETVVREVMVPRTDMITISADAGLSTLLEMIDEHGYSRIPVVGPGGLDDVIGMVIAKDLLPRLAAGERPELVEVIRPVDHVPETKRAPELLRDMQASKTHMAIVVDEFGGTAGLVTIEDLLEELVGEIVDEYDDDELLFEERGDGTWKVDGRLSVHDLSEMMDIELPDDEWDTVAGLVLGLAGRVPRERERFDIQGVSFTVRRVQGRRVQEVVVERLPIVEPAAESR
ncbi:MAG: hemolysin family protein [Acidimicrobiia bacterium]